jgi:RimJ/RimL family protein N-acetyltransferase
MNTTDEPTLHGDLVTLRPFSAADTDAMLAATMDPKTRRLTSTQATFTRDQIERWCEKIATSEGPIVLAIVPRENGTFLGEVVLNEIDPRNLSAIFRVSLASAEHFGKGYGSEAARLLLGYGFGRLGLNRIPLDVFDFSERAIHVYRTLGFREEGRLREVLLMDGRRHDASVMSMLRREYLPAAASTPPPTRPHRLGQVDPLDGA